MDSVRIKNLRCFKDTGRIELKPLTIAVGKNSCGKSTFLRVFPLFKQTLETRLSAPILWYGRYADFGEFGDSRFYSLKNGTIDFEFEFKTDVTYSGIGQYYRFRPLFEEAGRVTEIKVTLCIDEKSINKVEIALLGVLIEMIYDELPSVKVRVNGNDCDSMTAAPNNDIGDIIPKLITERDMVVFEITRQFMGLSNGIDENVKKDFLFSLIFDILKKFNIGKELIPYTCYIYYCLTEDILDFSKKYENIRGFLSGDGNKDSDLFEKYRKRVTAGKKNPMKQDDIVSIIDCLKNRQKEIENYIVQMFLPQIIEACNEYINSFFKNVKYVAPVRATAERYYRKQGLDLQEVDARGENVSAILQNMKDYEKKKFNDWLNENFGFVLSTKAVEGHVSINIQTNIADAGFGYSQILPILLLLWKSKNNEDDEAEFQIVIEQPELHLHPKMQMQLLSLILQIISSDQRIKFLLETHSETFINALGRLIEKGRIDSSDVNVLLVEQKAQGESTIRSVSYTQEGYLKDWPLDFFQEVD